ncbi:hypothetical protein G6F50_017425 [Rhizopus delemar]|uniref:Uncharacterized protein n=1 Tax=Rhizopus delemar TaxID=936053 RepID=A0A9P6XQC5_9FUNG|nr:hypothetical protein G6F50_017425 [Rhizopus delemar]
MELRQVEGHQRGRQCGRQWRVFCGGVADCPLIGTQQCTRPIGCCADTAARRRRAPAADAVQAPVAKAITQRCGHRKSAEQRAQHREAELADAGRSVTHGWNLAGRELRIMGDQRWG